MMGLLSLLACASGTEDALDPPPPLEAAPPPVEEQAPAGQEWLGTLPAGFVDLVEVIDNIRLDIRYHTTENPTEAPLPGYGAPGAWLSADAAASLGQVQAELVAEEGVALVIYDAYRPNRANRALGAWARRSGQLDLIREGYIEPESDHTKGIAVDATLMVLQTGELLDMGTEWGTFTEASVTRKASWPVQDHRQLLRDAMRRHGWRNNKIAWWHYTFEAGEAGAGSLDVPYGCFEAAEGAWRPPKGWNQPDWEAPKAWERGDCQVNASD